MTIVYNVPGIPKNAHLKLTGPVLADIFLGKIRSWDDERIKALNSDLPLPFHSIFVVHRSDPSWTTYVFTDYLSKASPEWKEKVGKCTSVDWPVEFIGMRKGKGRAMGTESVASWASSKPCAVGYVELSYVLANNLTYATLKNKAGNFVEPSQESEKVAIQAYLEKNLPPNSHESVTWEAISTVDAPGNDSYPLASFASYILVYKELSTSKSINTAEVANTLAGFIAWTSAPSTKKSLQPYLAPLPDSVIKLNKESIASLSYKSELISTSGPRAEV